MAAAGLVGVITHNQAAISMYMGVTAVVSALIVVGGVKAYMSQEMVDTRDVYREYREQYKRQIAELKESNISLQKQNIVLKNQLRGKETNSPPATIPEAGQHAAISIDGRVESE